MDGSRCATSRRAAYGTFKGQSLLDQLISWSVQYFCTGLLANPILRFVECEFYLLAGRPIVGTTWVDASARAGALVDAGQHLLEDIAAEKRWGFRLASSYERAQQRLILSGLRIYFTPGAPPTQSTRSARVLIAARLLPCNAMLTLSARVWELCYVDEDVYHHICTLAQSAN